MRRNVQIAKVGRKGFNGRKGGQHEEREVEDENKLPCFKKIEYTKVEKKVHAAFTVMADLITEFLEIISHTLLFNYGGYPAETFNTASYGSLLVHKCRVKEVLDYMSSALRTVHRWIKFDKLSHFAACILDKDDRVMMETVLIIMDVQCPHFRDILVSEVADLKRQLQQTIFTLQRGSYIEYTKDFFSNGENGYMDLGVKVRKELRFEIRAKLRDDCEVRLKKRTGEYEWEKFDQLGIPGNLRPCGRRIDNKLLELYMWALKDFPQCYCPGNIPPTDQVARRLNNIKDQKPITDVTTNIAIIAAFQESQLLICCLMDLSASEITSEIVNGPVEVSDS
uniref:HORMA domain-containing protein n=1 Tax=Setaria digitata TaxID=48799 RepID=A0A915Q7X1_9BILA